MDTPFVSNAPIVNAPEHKGMNQSESSDDTVQIVLSIIIPTLNDTLIREVVNQILDELSTLDKQVYASEIIVVGKDDELRLANLLPAQQPLIKFIDTRTPVGASVSRNIGICAASGDWFIFIDSDCLVQPGWAEAMTKRLAAGENIVGGGVSFSTNSYWPLVYNLSMFHEFLASRSACEKRYLPTLNLAIKRTVIDQIGYLDETLTRGQDMDWTIRMVQGGFRLFFEPTATISHQPTRADWSTVWRYWIKSGYYSSRNRRKYKDYYQTPKFLSYPWMMRLLSPFIALIVTTRIFLRLPKELKFVSTIPPIYMTKIAWCLGASSSISEEKSNSLL